MLVSISFSIIGYQIGRIVDVTWYTGQIIDTIVINSGQGDKETHPIYKIDIKGKILYTDGSPSSYGTVELRSEPRYTTTNSQGHFEFKDVEEGKHRITVMRDGVVLAVCDIEAIRSDLLKDVKVIKLADGSYYLELPLNLTIIDIILELDKEGGKTTLELIINPPGQTDPIGPDTPDPDEPIDPSEPSDPTDPIEPTDPPEIPDNPDAPPSGPGGGGGVTGPTDRPPGLKVTSEIYSSHVWSQSTSVDIFAQRDGNHGVSTLDGKNVIAPGSFGKYIFKVKNTESYPLKYNVDLQEVDQNSPKLPMRYRLKEGLVGENYMGGNDWKRAEDIKVLETTLAVNGERFYTLEWKWATSDNATDTQIGTQTNNPIYILDIIINAWFS